MLARPHSRFQRLAPVVRSFWLAECDLIDHLLACLLAQSQQRAEGGPKAVRMGPSSRRGHAMVCGLLFSGPDSSKDQLASARKRLGPLGQSGASRGEWGGVDLSSTVLAATAAP